MRTTCQTISDGLTRLKHLRDGTATFDDVPAVRARRRQARRSTRLRRDNCRPPTSRPRPHAVHRPPARRRAGRHPAAGRHHRGHRHRRRRREGPRDPASALPGRRGRPVRARARRVPDPPQPDRHVPVGRADAPGRGAQLRRLQPAPRQPARAGVHAVRHRRGRVRGRASPWPCSSCSTAASGRSTSACGRPCASRVWPRPIDTEPLPAEPPEAAAPQAAAGRRRAGPRGGARRMFEPAYLRPVRPGSCRSSAQSSPPCSGRSRSCESCAHLPVVVCAALSCACAVAVVAELVDRPKPVTFPRTGSSGEAIHLVRASSTDSRSWSVDFALVGRPARRRHAARRHVHRLLDRRLLDRLHARRRRAIPRYFAIVSLFLASMCLLVLADNFLLHVRRVGRASACAATCWSGYWHHKPSAADAARKAFLVTRLGDVGLILGIFLLVVDGGSRTGFDVRPDLRRDASPWPSLSGDVPGRVPADLLRGGRQVGAVPALRLAAGRDGGPDAGVRPDPRGHDGDGRRLPARALRAAVRRWCRASQLTVAIIGAFTALLAAFIALTQHDLKRVLAYSTVSQIGFMFLAVGCAGPVAASRRRRRPPSSTCSRTPSSRPSCSCRAGASCTRWTT